MILIPEPGRGILDDTDAARRELLMWMVRITAALKNLDQRLTALEGK